MCHRVEVLFFPPSHLFPLWDSKKKYPPLLSMWSNSSTPLKLSVGGHGTCGIHKSNFVCSVRSTKVTDATKRKRKGERISTWEEFNSSRHFLSHLHRLEVFQGEETVILPCSFLFKHNLHKFTSFPIFIVIRYTSFSLSRHTVLFFLYATAVKTRALLIQVKCYGDILLL